MITAELSWVLRVRLSLVFMFRY